MAEPHLSPVELAKLRTKKVWEKVIGGKWNPNDEVNHIAQQAALANLGMAMVSPVTGGKSGRKYQ